MPKVAILKSPDDPACLRASVGGTEEIGYYLNYRGKLDDVLRMLDLVRIAAEAQLKVGEPPVKES